MCPLFVNDFHNFEESVQAVKKALVDLSKRLDLGAKVDDVTELLASHGVEFSAEGHIQLQKQMIKQEKTPAPEPKRFTRKKLVDGFALID